MKHTIERVIRAIEDIRAGKMVILVDDEDRENEGDLTMAAEKVTPEAINFMAREGRGLICLTLEEDRIDRLKLPMMVSQNEAALGTAFTVSIEARRGVTTGISARDRATTILAAIAADARPDDLVSPGHVFPLKARAGGVLVRTGQTEGSVDLARLAGLEPAGVICEIMRDDGEMARMPDLERFSEQHDIAIVSIADLITYRLQREHIVTCQAEGEMRPAMLGPGAPFRSYVYGTSVEDAEYLALVRGDVHAAADAGEAVLVRVQSLCPLSDPFGLRPEFEAALRQIDEAGVGVFLYVYNKDRTSLMRAFQRHGLSEAPTSTGPAGVASEALRDFGLGAQVLADLGCQKVRLMSNSSRRIAGIEGFGIEVVERVGIEVPAAATTGRGELAPGRLRSVPTAASARGPHEGA
ncbi:3,4-dihydroxy-2-butanone-4-phosphate synthase [Haliangium sp.]|uniref:3,4-dihydroxy-2-butanone-4-phosphate synthase n=1 Tax=Haliangium sp. TaxID=2663208 RepID=UPI003D0E46B9